MPLHPLLHLIDYWYSHQLCRESPDPLLGCYPTVSFTSKILWVFPWYILPSVNCIIYFDSDTLLLNSYLLLGWWLYRFVKMPRWVELMPSIIRVNPRVLMSLTLLVLRQINLLYFNFFENKEWMKGYALKKWESTLNLCVHAHGPDVELIMEVAHKNNYFFGTSSSCIYELILCNRGSDHISSLIPFTG